MNQSTKSKVVNINGSSIPAVIVNCLDDLKPLDPMDFPNPPKSKGSLLPQTIPNLRYILNKYGVTVRYNVIKKKIEIKLPQAIVSVDNSDNVAMTYIMSLASLNGLNTFLNASYVEALAESNPYNPVKNWIESKPWDGVDRIPEIVATITTREDFPAELKYTLIYRWLLSAAAAVLKKNGFKARGVLTLQGPQGCGKTTWVNRLVPDAALAAQAIRVDLHLDPSNKDSILTAITHWIAEIGEVDSSLRKDVARLKGFLTSDQDKVRRPYAKGDSNYGRRTVFCATVNAYDFLVDRTGNTRWWVLPVESIDYAHNVDMQQVFAQLAKDFFKGEQWWLTKEEEALLEACNRDHQSISAIHELLLERIDLNLKGDKSNKAMSNREILSMLGYDRPTNPQFKESASILRDLIGEPKKINGTMKWRMPLRRESDLHGDLDAQIESIEQSLEYLPAPTPVPALLQPPRSSVLSSDLAKGGGGEAEIPA